ncbi:hypothetical protein EDB85DRAFT_1529515 [Lactarius pseudohatsudake]|nr:hypothetical protein EDB85DRAFT_1529515 [Lactarius pseudohatsudake]
MRVHGESILYERLGEARSLSRRLASSQRDTKSRFPTTNENGTSYKQSLPKRYQRFHIVGWTRLASLQQVGRVSCYRASSSLHPETHLLPSAHACGSPRSSNVVPAFFAFVLCGKEPGSPSGALGDLQTPFQPEGGFALGGQWSDASSSCCGTSIGNFAEGSKRRAYGEVSEENAVAYLRNMKGRPSWSATFDEVRLPFLQSGPCGKDNTLKEGILAEITT